MAHSLHCFFMQYAVAEHGIFLPHLLHCMYFSVLQYDVAVELYIPGSFTVLYVCFLQYAVAVGIIFLAQVILVAMLLTGKVSNTPGSP